MPGRPPPRLYAHRGAAAELPENTLPAFARALELGANALETDCHMTSDGHLVLSHDATGARMTGSHAPIARTTLADVKTWDAGRGFVDAAGGRPFGGRGFRVPTLDELLREFPGVPVNVDAKDPNPAMVARLLEVVRRSGAEERTLLASFDWRTLRRIRAAGYAGPTGLAREEVLQLLLLPTRVLRTVRVARLRGVAAQLPHRTLGIDLGTRRVIDKCHELGLLVHYWTVNDVARARELLRLGADGIMTDDPRAIAPLFADTP